MKKIFSVILGCCIFISTVMISFAASDIVTLYIGSNFGYVGGEKKFIDNSNLEVKPVVIDDRTLVPARFISEAFGAKVSWDDSTKTVTVESGNDVIKTTIGENVLTVNGNKTQLDVPSQIINGRTMLPLRAFATSLGKFVDYKNGLIAIGSDSEVKAVFKDADKYIKEKFVGESFAQIYNSNGEYGKEFQAIQTVCGNTYQISAKLGDVQDERFDSITVKINDASYTAPIDTFGMRMSYIVDTNSSDEKFDVFIASISDNDYIFYTAYQYDGKTISTMRFDYPESDKYIELDCLPVGNSPETLKLNENGSVSIDVRTNSRGMWNVNKTYQAVEGNLYVQEKPQYYNVNMESFLAPFKELTYDEFTLNFGGDMDDYAKIKTGYAHCFRDFGCLLAGDFFTIVYDDCNDNIFVKTTRGTEGWINLASVDDETRLEVSRIMFYQAG